MPPDSPHGVCPTCFLKLGFLGGSNPPEVARTEMSGRFTPPTPEQLAPHFPSLEILNLIGQGGMGAVYRARQRGLDRMVALKVLPPGSADDPAFAERFSREAKALAKLNHSHIVGIHDSGQTGGFYYFIMEFVDGVNLREALQTGQLTPKEALAIVPQICEALQYAHDCGVVHRDIKPENVLLEKGGQVKIADFGLARLLGIADDSFTLTATHQVVGTPRYMSPEQMEGAHGIDHRADIYSLGVVFYEMLTGELPLGRFEPPSRRATLDQRLDRIVMRTLEKEPDKRYQQASEIKSDVETFSRGGFAAVDSANGMEYRSKTTLFGLPLVHIATGRDPVTRRRRIAKGIIAIGDMAIGVIAIGGSAFGGFVLGGCAVGLFSIGGASIGLLAALGGAAVGLGFSVGGMAVGSVAIGGGALGIISIGGGGAGLWRLGPGAPDTFPAVGLVTTVGIGLAVLMVACVSLLSLGAAVLVSRERDGTGKAPVKPPVRQETRSALPMVLFLLVLVTLLGTLTFAGLGYVSLAVPAALRPTREAAPSSAVVSPALTDAYAKRLGVTPEVRQRLEDILESATVSYLALETENSDTVRENGRQVTSIWVPSEELEALERNLWRQVEEVLTVDQLRIARELIQVYGAPRVVSHGQSPLQFLPGMLGWRGGQAEVEVWRTESTFHWTVSTEHGSESARAPQLPTALERFWQNSD